MICSLGGGPSGALCRNGFRSNAVDVQDGLAGTSPASHGCSPRQLLQLGTHRHTPTIGGSRQQVTGRRLAPVTWAAAGGGGAPDPTKAADGDEELLIEKQMRANKKKKGSNKGPRVIAPVVEATRSGQPTTQAQQSETAVVYFLGVLFALILLLGLFLASAGLLSEAADEFAQNVVYPAYSPLVVFFLACSSGYGLWKTKQ